MNHDQRCEGGRERGLGGLLRCLLMSSLWLTSCGAPPPPAPPTPPPLPEGAIELELSDAEGTEWSLERARGAPLLLYFFTTWCRPCIALAQQLRRYERDVEDPLPRWGVCLDARAARRLSQFRQVTGLQHPLLLPRGALKQRETPLGPLSAVPEAWLIDEEGRVIERFYGSLPIEYLTRWYRERRAARAPQPSPAPAEQGGAEEGSTVDGDADPGEREDAQAGDAGGSADERSGAPRARGEPGVDASRESAPGGGPGGDSGALQERTEQDGG